MANISFTNDEGRLNPRLPLPDGSFADMMVTEPEKPGEEARVLWLPAGTMVDLYGKLAQGGHRPTYANVRSFLSEMPDVPGYDQEVFLRGGKVEYGAAKPQAPQEPKAGLGTGIDFLDRRFAGGGNAFMGGVHSVFGAAEGIKMKGALESQISLEQAKQGRGPVVTDAVHEATKRGLPPPEDPASVLADLVSQGMRSDSTPTGMGSSFGFYNPNYASYTQNTQNARNHPRHLAAVKAKEDADRFVQHEKDAQDKIDEQQRLRQMAYDIAANPPRMHPRDLGAGHFNSPEYQGLAEVLNWSLSLTKEQRASLTPGQIQTKVDELMAGAYSKEFARRAGDMARRDEKINYWDVKSKEMELYNQEGKGYADVGALGAFNVLWQQLMSSVPNTAATAGVTAAATAASGPAAPVAGPAAMAASTALLETGTGFNQAFGTWLAKQGIDLRHLKDPKSAEYAEAMTKLQGIAANDPAGVMGQMQEMLKASAKRGAISGGTAALLNVGGNYVQEWGKAALPKSYSAPMTSGSLVKPVAAAVWSPVRTFQGGIYKKIIFPRAANAAIDTAWEATEEALTDIITDVMMGESPDMKTALSSFLVGAKMGGISSFGFGKSNIDNPLEILQKAAEEGESGLDRVAAEIEQNTGMPAAKAKASIQKAGEILQQFETFAKRYPPTPEFRQKAWADFIKGYRGSRDALYSHEQDKRRARIKDRQTDLDALKLELEQRRLMAFNPDNVPASPLIPSLQQEVDVLKQGFDYTRGEGRYYHPLSRTPDADPPKK